MISSADYPAWRGRMPKYYKGKISGLYFETRDQYKWRRLFPNLMPYYVGESVKLIVSIERQETGAPGFSRVIISEKLPSSSEYIPRKPGTGCYPSGSLNKIEFPIRGDIHDTSGDTVWRLEVRSTSGEKEISTRIFDAGILNHDAKQRDIKLGLIFALIVALFTLLGEYLMSLCGFLK